MLLANDAGAGAAIHQFVPPEWFANCRVVLSRPALLFSLCHFCVEYLTYLLPYGTTNNAHGFGFLNTQDDE